MNKVKAALEYAENNFSVIPIQPNKTPHCPWKQYQDIRATAQEIKAWWDKWPEANVGIVTGTISGIVVVDIDTEDGYEAIQEYIPDGMKVPTVKSPGGWHLYFKAPTQSISNNTKKIPGCDFRGDGGYIVAPPSINSEKEEYTWIIA